MRILLVSSSSGSRGGGEIFLLYLGQALQAAGHTVALWTSDRPQMNDLAARFAAFGEIRRSAYRNSYDRWDRGVLIPPAGVLVRRLAAEWAAWRPDLVHLNKQNLEDGLDLLAAANLLRMPHVCTIHITQSARFLRARFAALRDAAARRALRAYRGHLVATAPARTADLAEMVGPALAITTVLNGISVQPNPIQPRAELRTAEGLRPNSLAIVAVGRIEAQKCPLRFLHHAKRIQATGLDVEMRWMGSGRLEAEWDREAAALQLGAFVQRIPWRDDVRQALPAYDVFLHTAAFEGFSLAILEAMEAGLPCLLETAVHAQLPAGVRACARAVDDQTDWKQFLARRPELASLGRNAQILVRQEYSTTAMARAYVELYRSLLAAA